MESPIKTEECITPEKIGFPVLTSVKGVGHYLPESIVDNSRFHNRPLFKYGYDGKILQIEDNRIVSTNDKIIQLMGIVERRYAGKTESVDYMAAKAIEIGRINKNSKVVMVSFGSGLVTSALALEY
tara:strand:- start:2537 stop:2914 length:378 start_codon:yes stop_codon:yes gene_type:complete